MKKTLLLFVCTLFLYSIGSAQDETRVTLSGGSLTIEDINGGSSNDNLTLTTSGANLSVSGLTTPIDIVGAGNRVHRAKYNRSSICKYHVWFYRRYWRR